MSIMSQDEIKDAFITVDSSGFLIVRDLDELFKACEISEIEIVVDSQTGNRYRIQKIK